MGAQIERDGEHLFVTCAEHDWLWPATSELHATNLVAKHDRENPHRDPAAVVSANITHAARTLLALEPTNRAAAAVVFGALLGIDGIDAAITHARELVSGKHDLIAHTAPF